MNAKFEMRNAELNGELHEAHELSLKFRIPHFEFRIWCT